MIFLEVHNRAVEDLLLYKFENAKNGMKHEKFDHILADFDGTVYRIRSVPNEKSKIIVSIILSCFQDLQANGAQEVLQRDYGAYLLNKPDEGSSVSLIYDLDNLPDNYAQLAQQASLLKRNCFAAAFERFFQFQALGEEAVGSKQAVIHYRPDETLYVQAMADRVTVIFSTVFKEIDDLIIAKVFLQELTEVRRRFDRAPQVLYSQSVPPAELQGTDAAVGDNVAYITFVLFPRHLTPTASPRTINLIHTLRNYLHYHIKCSKGYLHRRMHAKTTEFIKVLNRARPHYPTAPVIHVGPLGKPFLTTSMSLTNCLENNVNGNGSDDTKESSPEFPDPPQSILNNGNGNGNYYPI